MQIAAKRPWGLLVVAALFFAGFVINAVKDDLELVNTLVQAFIIAVALGAYWFVRRQQIRQEALARFLAENVDQLRAGTATFDGVRLTYATQLRAYEIVMSFLILTVRYTTRPVADGGAGSRSLQWGATLATFLLGWWGIPWGPIWTIRALARNARGGDHVSVGEVIEGTPHAKTLLAPARAR
jgi:hypothetical protein